VADGIADCSQIYAMGARQEGVHRRHSQAGAKNTIIGGRLSAPLKITKYLQPDCVVEPGEMGGDLRAGGAGGTLGHDDDHMALMVLHHSLVCKLLKRFQNT
jgi:hypothetical protein